MARKLAETYPLMTAPKVALAYNAIIFATKAHDGQMRDGLNEPYVCHPIRVAQMVDDCGYFPEVIAAAALHDVIEDCGLTDEDLIDAGFPRLTVNLVALLSKWWGDEATPEEVAKNKRIYYHEMLNSPFAMAVKMLDRTSNLEDLGRTITKFETDRQTLSELAVDGAVAEATAKRDEYVARAKKYLGKTEAEFGPLAKACQNERVLSYFHKAKANLQDLVAKMEAL